ncbi:MAG TPA: DUF3987 domain-containing protein [Candidatus Dormibacteraeota bacterium]|jgi:hypothetical protein
MAEDDGFVESLGRSGLYPQRGWIADYIRYAEQQTDAPTIYHLATGLATVSAKLGNRCWMELFGGKVYPSTWNVLLGDSSTMRKSTSIRLGVNVLLKLDGEEQRTEHENKDRGILLPFPGSREGLEGAMSTRSDGMFVSMEFGELLALLSRDHMASTKEMLTRWFDGDSSARATKGEQTKRIKDPAITILGASTTAWLEDRAKEGDIRGGFLARVLWWPAAPTDKSGWRGMLDAPSDSYEDRQHLANLLSRTNTYRGQFAVATAAKERFHRWLQPHEEGYALEGFPPNLSGFHGRLPVAVLKLAMSLEAATGQGIMLITDETMALAIRIGVWLKGKVADLFTDMTFTPQAQRQRQLLEALGRNGGTSRRDLLRQLRWPVREFEEVSATLVEQGRVTVDKRVPTGGGTTSFVYKHSTGATA